MIALVVLLGLVGLYWPYLLAAAALVWSARWACRAWREQQDELAQLRATNAALAARADEQHTQILDGDIAGMYGRFKPAID